MTLREQADLLIQSIESSLAEKQQIDDRAESLRVEELRLLGLEQKLTKKEETLFEAEKNLKKESDFLDAERQRVKIEGAKAAKYEDLSLKIHVELDELDTRKEEVRKKEIALEEKQKTLASLEEKSKDLQVREQKIEKENAISAERQRLFELREARIAATEKRLRLDDAYASLPQS